MTISKRDGNKYAAATVALYVAAETQLTDLIRDYALEGIDEPTWLDQLAMTVHRFRQQAGGMIRSTAARGRELLISGSRAAYAHGVAQSAKDLSAHPTVTGLADRSSSLLLREAQRVTGEVAQQTERAAPQILQTLVREAAIVTTTVGGSRADAVNQLMRLVVDRGIPGFVDVRQREWSMGAYIDMATRTIATDAMLNGYKDQASALGNDLVQVVENPDSCPICEPWEDAILSISGDTDAGDYDGYTVAGSVDDATADGLFHPNCRCVLDTYTPDQQDNQQQDNNEVENAA